MRHASLIAALLFLLTLAGCSKGSTTISQEAAEAGAAVGLLKLEDFPAGWTAAPPGADEDDLVFTGECEVLNEDVFPGQIADADSETFTGPDDQEVEGGTAVFPTRDEASDAMELFVEATDTCRDELESEFDRLFREGFEEADVGVPMAVAVTLEDLSLPVDADASNAFRVRFEVDAGIIQVEGTIDILFARQGRIIGVFSYFVIGEVDSAEEQQLADIAVERFATADESLD